MLEYNKNVIVVRSGGDLATGVVQKLYRAGFKVAVLEIEKPLAVRRTVSLCTAVTYGTAQVEDMYARLVHSPDECAVVWDKGKIPVLIDPGASCVAQLKPVALVDTILAKRNIGTNSAMAPVVVALGPGFTAPSDAHAVIETMRGHNLGRVIFSGSALPDTGVPGEIGGKSTQRVLRAPCDGAVTHHKAIGDLVGEGDAVLSVDGEVVRAPFAGVLRGLIQEGITVPRGLKIADIDPRVDSDCFSISDKARSVGGAVLEAVLYLRRRVVADNSQA